MKKITSRRRFLALRSEAADAKRSAKRMSKQRGIVFRRCLALLIVLFAGVSLAGAFVVFRQAKKYYTELSATRLDPLGIRQFEIPDEPPNPSLIFYGDSRAKQWSEPSWLKGRTLNLGIGAQTTEQILGRFDDHFARFRPQVVVFQAGINDLKTIPLFPESEEEIIEACKLNIGRIVGRCRERGSHVVLTTIFPVGNLPIQRRLFWSDRVEPAIEAVNRYIQSLASEDVSILVTSDILSEDGDHLLPEFSHDFLHLNEEGVKQLNIALRKLVEPVLVDTPNTSTAEQVAEPDL